MRKEQELSDPASCMSRARRDEWTFVLLGGRDAAAPVAIRAWIDERIRLGKNTPGDDQIKDAEACAAAMETQSFYFRRRTTMNATRCKMKLTSISESYSNGRTVRFVPVSGGSEENKRFYAATPSGQIEFTVSETAAKILQLDVAAIGAEFYVDITPAAGAV